MIYLWISTMSLFLQQISTNYDSITNPRHGPHSYLQTRTNIIFKVATPRLQRYHSVLPTPTLMGPTKHGALISSHFTNIDVLYTSVALNFVLFAGYSVQIYIPLCNFTLSRLWWFKRWDAHSIVKIHTELSAAKRPVDDLEQRRASSNP